MPGLEQFKSKIRKLIEIDKECAKEMIAAEMFMTAAEREKLNLYSPRRKNKSKNGNGSGAYGGGRNGKGKQ